MDILLSTLLTCEYAKDIISGVANFDEQSKIEIVEVIQSATEPGCFETQKPTEGTGS
tara:strand:- start:698 stop:868 length:171 start_codon:yes stop_codon:yes gene_type:complete